MKTRLTALALLSSVIAAPAFAAGDAEAGAKVFNKCQTCHVVADAAGEVLAGRNAKTGPNLYGIVGRAAGTYPEFEYGESIVALGAGGYAWTEEDLNVYLADPAKFLKDKSGDSKARSKMVFKLGNEKERADVVAFLATFGAAEAAPAEGEAAPAEGEATN